MCIHLGIVPIKAKMPDSLSPYCAGFFDADGTIGCYFNYQNPRIKISVSNKYEVDLLPYMTFGGKIYSDNRGTFIWSANSKADVLLFLEYYKSVGHFKSFKSSKFLQLEETYELKDLKAYRPNSIHRPRWDILYAKWNRNGYDD